MNFVEPIRDRKKIAQIKNHLRGRRADSSAVLSHNEIAAEIDSMGKTNAIEDYIIEKVNYIGLAANSE